MLKAQHLVDQQADEQVVVIQHQHSPLLARCGVAQAEEAAQVHHRQQPATQVGHPAHPRLHAGDAATARFAQHLGHFAHGRDEPLPGNAKANAAPLLHAVVLRRLVGNQQATAPVDVQQQLKGGQRRALRAGGQAPALL